MKEDNVFDFQEFKKHEKWTHFKAGVRDKYLDAKTFYQNNREECLILIPTLVTAFAGGIKFISKRLDARQDKIHRDREIYDRSLGAYMRMKRRPTQKEWDIIGERKANGENYYKILKEMKLLDRVM